MACQKGLALLSSAQSFSFSKKPWVSSSFDVE